MTFFTVVIIVKTKNIKIKPREKSGILKAVIATMKAMAPAALATIQAHFNDLECSANDFDLIITGDLGQLGKDALLTMAQRKGISLGGKLVDCGTLVFDQMKQDVHAGGSGCGCSAITLCGYFLNRMRENKFKKIEIWG